jgi:hypothetical protein
MTVPTHNDGGAIVHCDVPGGCHCNNGNTEVHTESIHIEEAEKGKECNHIAPPVPELPSCTQSITITTATRQKFVCTLVIAFQVKCSRLIDYELHCQRSIPGKNLEAGFSLSCPKQL